MTGGAGIPHRILTRALRARRQIQAGKDVVDRLDALHEWVSLAPPDGPSITVVTATKNRPDLLRQAIASVAASRAVTGWEHVIVDDGAWGPAASVVSSSCDDRIKLIRNEGTGLARARNCGLDHAAGAVIVYLDDDNLMHPLWLAAVTNVFAKKTDLDWGYGARLVEDRSALTPPGDPGSLPAMLFPRFDRRRLRWANYIDANMIAHRRCAPEARFDPNTSNHSDWDLVLRLATRSTPMRIPAIACAYRTTTYDRMSDRADASSDLDYLHDKHRF